MLEVWQSALVRIQEDTPRTWEQFFRHLVLRDHGPEAFLVEVPDDFFAQFFRDHYLSVLVDTVSELAQRAVAVDLVVRGASDPGSLVAPAAAAPIQAPMSAFSRASLQAAIAATEEPARPSLRAVSVSHAVAQKRPGKKRRPAALGHDGGLGAALAPAPVALSVATRRSLSELAADAGLNPAYTFDDFVVGSSNEFSYAASHAAAENPARAYNPLFLFGGVGLGKTHLLHAIGIEMLRAGQERGGVLPRVTYVSSEQFVNEVIEAIRNRATPALRHKYRTGCDVLLIDDIQFLQGKQSTQEEFFHTFNALHQAGKQIVLTSDKLPHEMPGLEERLRSRFGWGLVTDIQAPQLETRIAIIRKKAEAQALQIGDDVVAFLAATFHSNIRDIEGAMLRLKAFSELFRAPITMAMARSQLRGLAQERRARITMDRILQTVSEHYGVPIRELTGRRRQRVIAWPRHVAMYLCRKATAHSLPEIGRAFGGRDHTTVMHAVSKIEAALVSDPNVRSDVETIQADWR
jgi:chromosomal replication initiator protein